MWGSFGLFVCLLMISILLSFKGKPGVWLGVQS